MAAEAVQRRGADRCAGAGHAARSGAHSRRAEAPPRISGRCRRVDAPRRSQPSPTMPKRHTCSASSRISPANCPRPSITCAAPSRSSPTSRSITPISAKCAGLPAASTKPSPRAAAPSRSIRTMPAPTAISASRCSTRASSRRRSRYYDRAIALQDRFRAGPQQSRQRAAAPQALRRSRALLSPRHRIAAGLRRRLEQSRHLPARAQARRRGRDRLSQGAGDCGPNNPDTLDNLALALKDLDRLDEAADLLRRALVIEQNSDKIHLHYGAVLLDQHKVEEAAAAAERALALNADNHDAVNLMGRDRLRARRPRRRARLLSARARAQAGSGRRL